MANKRTNEMKLAILKKGREKRKMIKN